MKKQVSILLSCFLLILLALAAFAGAYAQDNSTKPYEEGQAGTGSGSSQARNFEAKPYAEGQGSQAAGFREDNVSPEGRAEGEAGSSGRSSEENFAAANPSLGGMTLLYRFSGVSDDGAQGTAGKEATTIHCTNIAPVTNIQLEVRILNYDGTVYTASVTMTPNHTYTFSTQATAIYFDDVIIGGGSGTPAIYQGSGQVWGDSHDVICSAQVVDPTNYPPAFAVSLELYQE